MVWYQVIRGTHTHTHTDTNGYSELKRNVVFLSLFYILFGSLESDDGNRNGLLIKKSCLPVKSQFWSTLTGGEFLFVNRHFKYQADETNRMWC